MMNSNGYVVKTGLKPQLGPEGVDAGFGGAVHFDDGGPGAGEAFGLPFAGGVDAHLGAVVGQARGVVERVDGAEGELDVALGVDVVGYPQDDLGNILDVAVLVDDDDDFGEHGLAERPDGVHHLARMTGITLADGDQHEVVKDGFDGEMDVDDFGDLHLHGGGGKAVEGRG